MRMHAAVVAGIAAAVAATAANGQVLFHDSFDAQHQGQSALNIPALDGWTITGGTVDLIGNGNWDFYTGQGLYLDLDGSTNEPALLATNMVLSPRLYMLTFRLGGSQRGDENTVRVRAGSVTQMFTAAANAPLTMFSVPFEVVPGGPAEVSFQNLGGDNTGAILDEVTISAIPEPAAAAILALGFLVMRPANVARGDRRRAVVLRRRAG